MKYLPAVLLSILFLGIGFEQGMTISLDARRIGMGGILLPSHGESHVVNPAYLTVREDSPLVVPIPLGLFAFLGNLPEFNPDAKDFDIIELTNLLFNPPFYLELRDLSRDDSTTIFIDIGENHLIADLDNLKTFMPRAMGVRADFDWPKPGRRREYVRVRLTFDGTDPPWATLHPRQGSDVMSSTTWANGLVEIAEGATVTRGELVRYIDFDQVTW